MSGFYVPPPNTTPLIPLIAENMPAFVQRLRKPFKRRSQQGTATSSLQTRPDKGKQRADDYNVEDYYDERPRRNSSPPPLPVITDSGPPTTHRYENEDIFWNSTMIEADSDPMKLPGRRNNQKRDGRFADTLNAHYIGGAELPAIREEIRTSPRKFRRSDATEKRRNEPHRDRQRDQRRGRDSIGNGFTVMPTSVPAHTVRPSTPRVQRARPDEPITPGTEAWDAFMDFPSENSMHVYRDSDGNRHVVLPVRTMKAPKTTTTTAKFAVIPEDPNKPSPIQEVNERQASRQLSPSPSLRRDAPLQDSQVLTWNLVLNRIMDNEYVDPAMKEAVKERVQSSTTTNGNGEGEVLFVTAAEAGLVPNFSYPITGSAFYDRAAAGRTHEESSSNRLKREGETNPHEQEQEKLINGITPDPPSSASSSSKITNDSLYRAPTPLREPADQIYFLLCSVLTPSELSLHYSILNISPPTTSPPFPAKTPVSDASSLIPKQERIIRKLNTVILGLQDRIIHLEDTLIPQLSIWLEKKSDKIDILTVDLLNSRAEIADLKYAVDFGNKVLGGCFEREWEVWRTLAVIRAKRTRPKIAILKRLLRRDHPVIRDQDLGDGTKLPGYEWETFGGELDPLGPNTTSSRHESNSCAVAEQQPTPTVLTPRTTGSNMTLSKRELDALLGMAALSLRILREDADDMVTLIQDIKRRGEEVQEVEPVEGSWRDV